MALNAIRQPLGIHTPGRCYSMAPHDCIQDYSQLEATPMSFKRSTVDQKMVGLSLGTLLNHKEEQTMKSAMT